MKTTFHVQFMPKIGKYSGKVEEITAVAVSTGKLRVPKGGAVLVKFQVDFDDRIFAPFEPSVVVSIPLAHPAVIVAESVEVDED